MLRPPADVVAAIDAAARCVPGVDEHVIATVVGVSRGWRPWPLG
jgi:hypothetical protein